MDKRKIKKQSSPIFFGEELDGIIDKYKSRESLEKLEIFELRRQARFVGVERPVSKSREQIIAEMLQIINGKTT